MWLCFINLCNLSVFMDLGNNLLCGSSHQCGLSNDHRMCPAHFRLRISAWDWHGPKRDLKQGQEAQRAAANISGLPPTPLWAHLWFGPPYPCELSGWRGPGRWPAARAAGPARCEGGPRGSPPLLEKQACQQVSLVGICKPAGVTGGHMQAGRCH